MSLALAAALAFSSTATVPACSWDQPGTDPFMGNVVEAVERYTNIPLEVRDALKRRMAARQYDEIVTIRRDSITGSQRYSPEIRDMHFGQGRVCRSVSRAAWSPSAVERGLVYCEAEHCIIVPTVCRNVSRVTRLPAARPVLAAGPSLGAGLPPALAGGPATVLAAAGPAVVSAEVPAGSPAGGTELVFEPPGAGAAAGVPEGPTSAIWAALASIAGAGLNSEGGGGAGGGASSPAINFNPYATGGAAGGGGSVAPGTGGTTTPPSPAPTAPGPGEAIDPPSPVPPVDPLPVIPPVIDTGLSPAIPEPGKWALLLAGGALLMALQRRRAVRS
jgi:hypothetical protein